MINVLILKKKKKNQNLGSSTFCGNNLHCRLLLYSVRQLYEIVKTNK